MALATNSYGDTSEIAALVPRRQGSGGFFDASTRPTLTQVESMANQVSALLNSILAQNGFAVPVTNADVVLMLDYFVNEEVAAIVEGVNGSGRFGSTAKSRGARGRFALIVEDVEAFVKGNAIGMERLGATRTYDILAGMAYRDTDEGGDATFPLFQRDGFGNTDTDWDS